MKKAILSLLALPLLFACSSEDSEIAGNAGRVPLQIEFGDITRAALEGSTLPDNAQYGVFAASTTAPYNSLLENGENRCVTYSGGKSTFDQNVYIPEGKAAYVWAYYPYNSQLNRIVLSDGWNIDAQSQTDYLLSNSYQTATESSPTVRLSMRHLMSRIHITVKKAADNTTNYYYKEAYLYNAYRYGRFFFTNTSMTLDNKTTITLHGYMTNGDSSLQDGKTIEFDFLVLPTTNTHVMRVELPNSSPVLSTSLPERRYVAGEQYNITLTINHLGELTAGEWTIVPWQTSTKSGLNVWKDDQTGEEEVTPTPTPEEHEYVDLGLPSGTLWATCNVGASKPEEIGGRYAWGEIEEKSEYTWATYKWCEGTEYSQTKYCSDSRYGIVDNLKQLELSDDVAHVKWGGNWRIPTDVEVKELISYCKFAVSTINESTGYMVSGPNGKTIFLPIVKGFGHDQFYWTCTYQQDYSVYELGFNEYNNVVTPSIYSVGKCASALVRPIMSKQ